MLTKESVHLGESRCCQAAYRIASAIRQLDEPFKRNTIHWLESCIARPIHNLDEDLATFFQELNPGMRDTTMSSLEFVLEEAVRHFGNFE